MKSGALEYIPKYLYKKQLLRPIKLGILFSVTGEALIFLIWGLWLYPEGNILHKFLWTVVFCGLGMGATAGALISWWVEGKFWGKSAIWACAAVSFVVLGLFCNFLCFQLDMHFGYFGGEKTPLLFLVNGMIMSALGGAFIGWLNFTHRGIKLLEKYGW